jgi:hypothetical protein
MVLQAACFLLLKPLALAGVHQTYFGVVPRIFESSEVQSWQACLQRARIQPMLHCTSVAGINPDFTAVWNTLSIEAPSLYDGKRVPSEPSARWARADILSARGLLL